MPLQSRVISLAAATLVLATGCGAAVRSASVEVPRRAVPVTIDEMLKAGEDARVRERVAAVLSTPEMQRAIAEIARAAVAAGLDEAASHDSEQRIAELTDVIARALAENIRRDIVPAAVAGARESLGETVSREDAKALKSAVASVTAAAVSAALRAAANDIPTTLGPAVRESLARELRAPDLRESVAGLVDGATRQVMLSSRQVVAEAQQQSGAPGTPRPLLQELRRLLTLSWGLAFTLAVVGAALVAWILRLRRRAKRYRGALVELIAKTRREGEAGEAEEARMHRFAELLQ